MENLTDMSLSEIANIIQIDWKKVNFAAVPYLDAMHSLQDMDSMFYADDAKSIILYFLSNATSWRGETAKKVKAELKRRTK